MSIKSLAVAASLALLSPSVAAQETPRVEKDPIQGLVTVAPATTPVGGKPIGIFATMQACQTEGLKLALFIRRPFRWTCTDITTGETKQRTFDGPG